MPQENAVQDVVDAVNNCCLAMWKEASLMDNDVVSIHDIAELEGKQDECEQNLRRAREYVLQWQRSLAELKEIQHESSRRADVLQSWTRAVREQLPGLVTASNSAAAPAHQKESLLQQLHLQRLEIDSPRRGVGAHTMSLHSSASGPSENPQVLRDVINSAAAAATNPDQQGAQGRDTAHAAVPKRAPRPFVTKSELDQCSSYLVGRWTQSKINAAIEELAGFAEYNAKQMAALKSKVSTFKSSEARKRMLDISAVAKANPRMHKHFWFLESDLKGGSVLKCDRSGKGLLQLLRHLKRFSEVRCKVRNEADIVYIYEVTG